MLIFVFMVVVVIRFMVWLWVIVLVEYIMLVWLLRGILWFLRMSLVCLLMGRDLFVNSVLLVDKLMLFMRCRFVGMIFLMLRWIRLLGIRNLVLIDLVWLDWIILYVGVDKVYRV